MLAVNVERWWSVRANASAMQHATSATTTTRPRHHEYKVVAARWFGRSRCARVTKRMRHQTAAAADAADDRRPPTATTTNQHEPHTTSWAAGQRAYERGALAASSKLECRRRRVVSGQFDKRITSERANITKLTCSQRGSSAFVEPSSSSSRPLNLLLARVASASCGRRRRVDCNVIFVR